MVTERRQPRRVAAGCQSGPHDADAARLAPPRGAPLRRRADRARPGVGLARPGGTAATSCSPPTRTRRWTRPRAGASRVCRSRPTTRRCASRPCWSRRSRSGSRCPPSPTGSCRSTGSARWSSTASGGWTSGGWAATAAGSSSRCATAAPARTTYGGGRYLLDTVKGADLGGTGGRLVVDLNFAYHPSCTYDPRWSCPLAPGGQPADDGGRRRGAAAPRRLVLSSGAPGRSRVPRRQPWARAPSELKTSPIETSPCWMAALVSGPPASNSWKLGERQAVRLLETRAGRTAGSGHSGGPPRTSEPSPHASASSDSVATPSSSANSWVTANAFWSAASDGSPKVRPGPSASGSSAVERLLRRRRWRPRSRRRPR